MISEARNLVLKARQNHATSTLAELHDPTDMTPDLMEAHKKLAQAFDAMCAYKGSKDDPTWVAFLFVKYQGKSKLLPVMAKKKTKPKLVATTQVSV